MEQLSEKFIENVIADTNKGYLAWDTLFDLFHKYDESELPGFRYLIYQNEFHLIDSVKSYMCISYYFVLLILKETFISGRDDSISEQINVYLSKDLYTSPQKVDLDSSLLNVLLDEITNNYLKERGKQKNKSKQFETESIMKFYLDSSAD